MTTKRQTLLNAVKKASAEKSSPSADLKSLEHKSIASMENALSAIRELASARFEAKMSVSRLTGVARELRELIKVMSVYGV